MWPEVSSLDIGRSVWEKQVTAAAGKAGLAGCQEGASSMSKPGTFMWLQRPCCSMLICISRACALVQSPSSQ